MFWSKKIINLLRFLEKLISRLNICRAKPRAMYIILITFLLWFKTWTPMVMGQSMQKIYEQDRIRAAKLKIESAQDYWYRDNNYTAAKQELLEYLDLYPNGKDIFEAYQLLGHLYQIQRKMQKAIALWDEFYERFSNHKPAIEAKFKVCQMLAQIGKWQQAKSCLILLKKHHSRYSDINRKVNAEWFMLQSQFPDRDAKKPEKKQDAKQKLEENVDDNPNTGKNKK